MLRTPRWPRSPRLHGRLARTPPNLPARLLEAIGPAATRPARTTHPQVARFTR